ncbi:MAG: aminotransferase class V-fold PLP-dependent enzyme [Staphylothermus sp.]|nr:aminotransferase class V-fold PLP-dependent enzyme [Staphylothermus sp.]
MLNAEEIRRDFPILEKIINGKKLIYFDNAATTQKPIQVIQVLQDFYTNFNANIHRGLHYLSQKASEMYEEAHDIVAQFIGAESRRSIIFVRNTTEAINLVAYAWGLKNLREGDEIIVSLLNHHSGILPWIKIAELKNARIKVVGVTSDGRLDMEKLKDLITRRTRIVSIVHMSNVTGTVVDIKRVNKLAHEHGVYVVVDGAQSVPHMPINVRDLDIDFLTFSGHKMLGPTGIGVLYVCKDLINELESFITGGGAVKEVHYKGEGFSIRWAGSPWIFEAGTPNIAGGIGFAEAVKYLERIGMKNIWEHEVSLVEYLFKRLKEEELDQYIQILGPKNVVERGGIVSFKVKNLDPHALHFK